MVPISRCLMVVAMILSSFFLCSELFADDAWKEYRQVKETQATQNQELMQQFKDGKISAQQLEDAWKQMDSEAAQAAGKVENEWAEGPKKEAAPAGEKAVPVKKDAEKPAAQPQAPAEGGGESVPGTEFKVNLPEGSDLKVDQDFSDMEIETDPIDYRNGSEPTTTTKQPGIPKHSNITLKWNRGDSQLTDFKEMTEDESEDALSWKSEGASMKSDELVRNATPPHPVGPEWSEMNDGDFTAVDRAGGQLWRDFNDGKISKKDYESKSEQLREARENYSEALGNSLGTGVDLDKIDGALERDIDAIMHGRKPSSLDFLNDYMKKNNAFDRSDGVKMKKSIRKDPWTGETRDIGKVPVKKGWDEDHHH